MSAEIYSAVFTIELFQTIVGEKFRKIRNVYLYLPIDLYSNLLQAVSRAASHHHHITGEKHTFNKVFSDFLVCHFWYWFFDIKIGIHLTFRRLAVDDQYSYILTIEISIIYSASKDVYTWGYYHIHVKKKHNLVGNAIY